MSGVSPWAGFGDTLRATTARGKAAELERKQSVYCGLVRAAGPEARDDGEAAQLWAQAVAQVNREIDKGV